MITSTTYGYIPYFLDGCSLFVPLLLYFGRILAFVFLAIFFRLREVLGGIKTLFGIIVAFMFEASKTAFAREHVKSVCFEKSEHYGGGCFV